MKSDCYIQCTEVRFASFLFGGFITAIVVNPPERKLAIRTSMQSTNLFFRKYPTRSIILVSQNLNLDLNYHNNYK